MIQIVTARETHIPEIVELWKELMDFHREGDPFYIRSHDGHHRFEKYVRESMESQNSQVLVALEGEKVVACSISNVAHYPPVFERTTYGFISDMVVKKDYRRQGIAKRLLSEIRKWFSQQGVTRLELRVSSENEVAHSFWSKHGFKEYIYVMCLEE